MACFGGSALPLVARLELSRELGLLAERVSVRFAISSQVVALCVASAFWLCPGRGGEHAAEAGGRGAGQRAQGARGAPPEGQDQATAQ